MRIVPGAIGTVSLTGTADVAEIPGDSFDSVDAITVANTATVIMATATGTRSVILKADPDNSEPCYVGAARITNPSVTKNGIPLAAGDGMVVTTTADVYAISENGSQTMFVARVFQS